MEIKILWTNESRYRLKEIFDYLAFNSSENRAFKIVNEILASTNILFKNPEIGQREKLLKNRKNNYRYLLCRKYKIIYWQQENFIYIATVFDTRQNPKRLKDIKD
jgi:plasmid stabilization system protein ParE